MKNFFLSLHIVLSFLSYVSFSLAFFSGLVFLWMEKRLKTKHLPKLGRIQWSLQSVDSFNAKALMFGFSLLSFGIAAGILATQQTFGRFFIGDPKEVWTFLSWLLYAAIIGVRCSCTLRGRKVILLASLAFGMILFTFIGVNLFFTGIHSIHYQAGNKARDI